MVHLDGPFIVNAMLFNGDWMEIGGTLSEPLNLTVQCQEESVLSWLPQPYPYGTFNCSTKAQKMKVLCLTKLSFGKNLIFHNILLKNT